MGGVRRLLPVRPTGRAPRVVGAVVGLGVVAASVSAFTDDGYEVQVALASATNVVAGAPVLVDGFESGSVRSIDLEDGRALLTLALDEEVAPLHDGALVVVGWKATLSERLVEITDGPAENAEVPDGGLVPGEMPVPVEVDDVLSALDAPTRATLQSLLTRTSAALEGNEADANATLRAAGPTLAQLGEVLRALGTDGPAIENLVARLDEMLGVLAARDGEVQGAVDTLGDLTTQVATRREELSAVLDELPATLGQAEDTLALVPSVADEVVPLLGDLEPATAQLTPVAEDLAPLLADLRPLVADLGPATSSLQALLEVTPGLLGTTRATLPGVTETVGDLRDPVAFLRPYTPEVTGFFSTWASAFANYDANGNFARIHGQAGATSLNENPGLVPPGVTYDPYPEPGAIVDQPWTDAYGSELQ